MTGPAAPELFATGLDYPECPRWHDGALWLSEMWAPAVVRINGAGRRDLVHRFADDESPGGLGWLPGGRLLVVGMNSRCIYRFDPGGRVVHADLGSLSPWALNDMAVGPRGDAYVSQVGFDLAGGTSRPGPSPLIRVDPSGVASVAANGLVVPNGVALSGDGATLVVAETFAGRLTSFAVRDDGSLGDRRLLADLPPASDHRYSRPDGVCLDQEGGAWVADWRGCQVLRVSADGAVTGQVSLEAHALAVVLGGTERRTLFICSSTQMLSPSGSDRPPAGSVFAVRVDVPGTGEP